MKDTDALDMMIEFDIGIINKYFSNMVIIILLQFYLICHQAHCYFLFCLLFNLTHKIQFPLILFIRSVMGSYYFYSHLLINQIPKIYVLFRALLLG